jgi:hypothetical protein
MQVGLVGRETYWLMMWRGGRCRQPLWPGRSMSSMTLWRLVTGGVCSEAWCIGILDVVDGKMVRCVWLVYTKTVMRCS